AFHDLGERRRCVGGDRTRDDLARHGQPAIADHGTNHAWLHELAAVGDDADRLRHLPRRDSDLIAHRHRRQRAIGELRRIPDDAWALTTEIWRRRLAEAESAHVVADLLRPEFQRDLD